MTIQNVARMLILAVVAGAFVGVSSVGSAEPYIAQREGYKCSKCHVNRTGGGKRTAFGTTYAQTHLTTFASAPTDPDDAGARFPGMFDPYLNESVSVGANFRLSHTTTFADEVHDSFENPEADLYVQLDALEWLTLYTDISVAEGGVEPREAFILTQPFAGFHVKAGYLLPPFGLRIWGDAQYTRAVSGFNYAAPDLGVEIGYERGPVSIVVAATNGAGGGIDADVFKQVSGILEHSWPWLRIGLSGSFNQTDAERRWLGGGHVGTTLGRLTLLAEADVIGTLFDKASTEVHGMVVFAEADFLILRGLNAKVSYGFHDPALDVEQDQRFDLGMGLEWFPVPYLQASAFYTLRESVPVDEVGNADVLFVELHLYL